MDCVRFIKSIAGIVFVALFVLYAAFNQPEVPHSVELQASQAAPVNSIKPQ